MGKSFKLGMFTCQPSKRTVLIRVCGQYQTGREDRKRRTDLSGRINIISRPCMFGLHSKRMPNKQGYFGKLPTRASGKSDAETKSSWSYDMEGHAKKCVERYCELANKTTQQLYKVATPCMDDHQVKEEENESVGELSTVCSQIVLKCLYVARIGRPDILWSVNKLVRAVAKWKNLVTNAWRV